LVDPDYALFAEIVAQGSVSAGARSLRISPAMASKRLARLEARLGGQLLRRTTRRMELTETGARFHADVVEILAAIEAAEARVLGRRDQPAGLLRIAAPTSFGRLHVAPVLADFLGRFPEVTAELDLSDDYVDLLKSRIDVAVRITTSVDSMLVGDRLADSRRVLCAAPAYLARHGTPSRLADLARHRLLAARGQMPWRLACGTRLVSHFAESHVATNSSEVVRELTLCGVGIALRSLWDVSSELASGRLVRVLSDCEGSPDVGIFAVRPRSPYLPAATSLFIAALAAAFGPVPPWECDIVQ
jgi:DNA-binding transcriptional LysR family regulator